jgi:hypothetical protein
MTDPGALNRFTGGSITSRQDRMPEPLRGLHRAVLRRFLETGPAPTRRWVRQAAGELGLDASAVDELEAADAIHVSNGVVIARATDCGTECGSFEAMCPNTVFHASRESAQAYLAGRGNLDADILGQEIAIERGRLNFGALLGGDS